MKSSNKKMDVREKENINAQLDFNHKSFGRWQWVIILYIHTWAVCACEFGSIMNARGRTPYCRR